MVAWEEREQVENRPPEEEQEDAQRSFIAFEYNGRLLAVPFEHVRRVARLETFSPLPAAVPMLPGATNVNGRIVAVLDVGPLLGMPTVAPRPGMYLVVVGQDDLEAGLVTSRAPTLHEVPSRSLRDDDVSPFLEATYPWPPDDPDRVAEVLAVPRVLAAARHAYE